MEAKEASQAEEEVGCNTCIYYLHDCLIAGDLVHWCKAYAEVDPHERLSRLNREEGGD